MASQQKPTGTLVITGGGGYVGGNIVRLALSKGYAVRLTARSDSSAQKAAALHPQYVNTPQLTTTVVPPFDFGGYADSGEVAQSYLRALEVPKAAGQRFLVGQGFRYQLAVDSARESIPELKYRLPVGRPGFVEPAYEIDGSKVEKVLGLEYKTLAETVRDTYSQLWQAKKTEGTA
ncbi:Uu.00g111510.m01.CDS01 [Anthostomella pinea]|uniref:Uu.00g111510.m01.CDS01 n=1 Tax=Anthostomella pinea TaxID=933095 RepID=A0AAI8VF04_9PEZI|nr:Uu.00g111510.m01.CDS01 [Anthostomella pinea]